LAPILNTLVGHIWGYYAALAIHEGSRFLFGIQEELKQTVDEFTRPGLNVYEIILEKSFREKIARFYTEFQLKRAEKQFPLTVGFDAVSD
jgi:glutamine---fructose-6-phosphate transaminase (isomerizing)